MLSSPILIGLAAAAYILFFHKSKDETEGSQAPPAAAKETTLAGRLVDRLESRVLQKAQAAAAKHGLPVVAELIAAVDRGDAVGLATVAENLVEQLATPEGRRYMLGKAIRGWIAEAAVHDPGEFSAIAAAVNDRKKDVEDNAKRIAADGSLKAQ